MFEEILKVFNGDDERAQGAVAMLVVLLESHGESYGYDYSTDDYKEIHLVD